MNETNTHKLYADFPRLYRLAIAGELMHYGIECEDGWFNLIHKLSADIEAEAARLALDEEAWPAARQAKEKMGTLRFYCAAGTLDEEGRGMVPSIYSLIEQAAEESSTICEACGCPGTFRNSGAWLRTICDQCEALRQARHLEIVQGRA
jgi:hypothetical protein